MPRTPSPRPHCLICACIDIGSNTTRLLVADAGEGRLRELVTQRAFTRIGKSLGNGAVIPAEKIAETAEVVRTQAAVAAEVGAENIVAVATAAIRTARNRDELVDAVQEAGGMELASCPARRRRASRSWAPRAPCSSAAEGTVAVIDVGGGSSEIAIGLADGEMTWSESFRIGSGFLADAYLRSDPPSADELEKLRRHVDGHLRGSRAAARRERGGGGRHRDVAAPAGGRGARARDARARHPRAVEHADRARWRSASSSTPSACASCPPAS